MARKMPLPLNLVKVKMVKTTDRGTPMKIHLRYLPNLERPFCTRAASRGVMNTKTRRTTKLALPRRPAGTMAMSVT